MEGMLKRLLAAVKELVDKWAGSSTTTDTNGDSIVGRDCSVRAYPVNSESKQAVISHITVRIDVIVDASFDRTGIKNFEVSRSSFGRIFGTGSAADGGESNMRQV